MKTTFEALMENYPCNYGRKLLIKNLGRSSGEVSFKEILESNGILDAVWCLCVFPDYDFNVMKFKLLCARRIEHMYSTDATVSCLNVLERYIKGATSAYELVVAQDKIHYNAAGESFLDFNICCVINDVCNGICSSALDMLVTIGEIIDNYYDDDDKAKAEMEYFTNTFKEIFCKDD